jgi:hypothetical protein
MGRQKTRNSAVTPSAPPGLAPINIETPGSRPRATFFRASGAAGGYNIRAMASSASRKSRATPIAQRDNRTCRGRRLPAEWTPNINKRRATGCDKAVD